MTDWSGFWMAIPRKTWAVLRGHPDVVRSLAFSPDGSLLVSSGQDREIMLWDAIKGSEFARWAVLGRTRFRLVAFSPTGDQIAVGEVSITPQPILLIDPHTGEIRSKLAGHASGGVNALAFSPDGQTLATAGTVDRVDQALEPQGRERASHARRRSRVVRSISFSPDGTWLAYAGNDLTIRVWHLSREQTLLVGRCPLKT